jgi:transaldolase
MPNINQLKVKLFADGADLNSMLTLYRDPNIKGFTTNPTLMKKVGITDYESFAKEVLATIPDRPVSFEVFADDLTNMLAQAKVISSWGPNVNVKIPITNTKGEFTGPIIQELAATGVQLNITAIMTPEQVKAVAEDLSPKTPAIISVFAGRIADTGLDPMPIMRECVKILQKLPKAELLWASPRELLNIIQANEVGCHIITATPDILSKLKSLEKDLGEFSLETVQMFYDDAKAAGYTINVSQA